MRIHKEVHTPISASPATRPPAPRHCGAHRPRGIDGRWPDRRLTFRAHTPSPIAIAPPVQAAYGAAPWEPRAAKAAWNSAAEDPAVEPRARAPGSGGSPAERIEACSFTTITATPSGPATPDGEVRQSERRTQGMTPFRCPWLGRARSGTLPLAFMALPFHYPEAGEPPHQRRTPDRNSSCCRALSGEGDGTRTRNHRIDSPQKL
jgi:hypothetical protein